MKQKLELTWIGKDQQPRFKEYAYKSKPILLTNKN